MDAIVGARAEGRPPSLDDLTAIGWARPGLALTLVLDHSGSMNGARLTTAAVTGAACLTLAPADDDAEARKLARESGGRVAPIGSVLDVSAALNRMLADPGRY